MQIRTNKRYAGSSNWTVKVFFIIDFLFFLPPNLFSLFSQSQFFLFFCTNLSKVVFLTCIYPFNQWKLVVNFFLYHAIFLCHFEHRSSPLTPIFLIKKWCSFLIRKDLELWNECINIRINPWYLSFYLWFICDHR